MRNKGFAIILVLATLVLLALLSLTYIKLALIDRNIARNYMDNKRAKLIAQSGVDYAIARIQESDLFDSIWQYKDELNPSFVSGTVTINGQIKGYSQTAGSTYSPNGDLFVLKIDDSQSRININDGLGNVRVRANLARIINNLSKVIDASFPDLGSDIIGNSAEDKRPPGGYSNVSELKRVLTGKYGAIGEDYYKKLRPFITTHAWQDPDVANPVPLSNVVLSAYGAPYSNYDSEIGVYRYGRGKASDGHVIGSQTCILEGCDAKYAQLKFAPEGIGNPLGTGDLKSCEHAIYGVDELNPQWIEIVSRSPVNINQAREEILISLLKDLRGLFCSDRRSNTFVKAYDLLLDVFNPPQNLSSRGSKCAPGLDIIVNENNQCFSDTDELGFLYSTEGFTYDPVTKSGTAKTIAEEIIKCRANDASYAGEWFRGHFKTWRQFNAFVDNLVLPREMIKDSRDTIFFEYKVTRSIPGVSSTSVDTVSSGVALKIAHQAKADCLKANFNPNLHLNETNPDANIKTLVDKTDMIVNSTEFCFTPMGNFIIESEGLILKDKGGDNWVVADSKIEAVIKLFDVYRETSQNQFLRHITPANLGSYLGASNLQTSNERTTEIGPEPSHILDNTGQIIAKENEYSGYIALPTINVNVTNALTGDSTTTTSLPLPPPTTKTTTTTELPQGGFNWVIGPWVQTGSSETVTSTQNDTPQKNWTTITKQKTYTYEQTQTTTTTTTEKWTTTTETDSYVSIVQTDYTSGLPLYAHFRDNFNLDQHANGLTTNLTSHNASDPTEVNPGPYNYTTKNRLARSFRSADTINPQYYAMSDFRVDGAYAERHSGLAYELSPVGLDVGFNVIKDLGVACYWVKPWFYPEQTGKPRSFLNMSHSETLSATPKLLYTFQFINLYSPSKSGFEQGQRYYFGGGTSGYGSTTDNLYYRQDSIMFGISEFVDPSSLLVKNGGETPTSESALNFFGGNGKITPCLNHNYHNDGQSTYLKSGQWMHIIFRWNFPGSGSTAVLDQEKATHLFINGTILPETDELRNYFDKYSPLSIAHALKVIKKIYIGPAGLLSEMQDSKRNWSADSTIDEFHIIQSGLTRTVTRKSEGTSIIYTKITVEVQEVTITRTRTDTVVEVYDNKGSLNSSATTAGTPTDSISPVTTTITETTSSEAGPSSPTETVTYVEGEANADALNQALSIYSKGRYLQPSANQSYFISQSLDLVSQERSAPYETGIENPATLSEPASTLPSQRTKITGISWTYYGESVDSSGNPVVKNYRDCETPENLIVRLKVSILENNTPIPGGSDLEDDGYSQTAIQIDPEASYRYKVTFQDLPDPINTALLYSPIFDDITIYYQSGVQFLSYSPVD